MGNNENSLKREIHSNTGLPQQMKNPKLTNFTLKGTWKRITKPKDSGTKEIIKSRAIKSKSGS